MQALFRFPSLRCVLTSQQVLRCHAALACAAAPCKAAAARRHEQSLQQTHLRCRCSSTASSSGSSSATSAATLAADGVSSLKRKVDSVGQRVDALLNVFDMPSAKARLASLEHDASAAGIWDDAERGQEVLSKLGAAREELDEVQRFVSWMEEARFAVELLEADAGSSAVEQASIVSEALSGLQRLEARLEQWELRKLLAGAYDESSARLSITAGAGGVDAMDW